MLVLLLSWLLLLVLLLIRLLLLLLLIWLVLALLLLFLLPGLPPLLLLLLSFDSLGVHDRCSVYNTAAVPYHTGSCDCYRHFLQWQPLQLG